MREIIGHLIDEETDDFRARLKLTLADPSLAWPAIDPPARVRERSHQSRAVPEMLMQFRLERARSVDWLESLAPTTDWRQAHVHPKFGSIAAGDLLASWVAHDALHLRQIAKRWYELASDASGGFQTTYAGDWGA